VVEGQGMGDYLERWREGLKHEWTSWIYGKGDRNLTNGWERIFLGCWKKVVEEVLEEPQ